MREVQTVQAPCAKVHASSLKIVFATGVPLLAAVSKGCDRSLLISLAPSLADDAAPVAAPITLSHEHM